MIRYLIAMLIALTGISPATTPATTTAATATSFTSVDLFVDTHGQALAAYQLEIKTPAHVIVVGIEAGEHAAFAKTPPYYDPAAMGHERVVLAAFSTDHDLPHGRTRIARLHVMIDGQQPARNYTANLLVAADAEGKTIIGAAVSVQ
jgi:hypothetical protein